MSKYVLNDKGVTLVEIMIATIIMFLSLMAIIGLFMTAVRAATMAKVHTIANEFANKKVEEVRALPYDKIGIQGGTGDTPSGSLPETETATLEGGVEVSLIYDVDWVDDPEDGLGSDDSNPNDYKLLTIEISWTNNETEADLIVTTNIRQKEHRSENPSVDWGSYTPQADPDPPVIWSDVTLDGQARDPDGTIDSISFYCGGRKISSYGPYDNVDTTETATTTWNTTELISFEEDPEHYGEPKYEDGLRDVMVEAYDNLGKRDFRIRYMVIDNYPPEFEDPYTTLSVGMTTETSVVLVWTLAMDGTDYCYRYLLYYKKSGEGTWIPYPSLGEVVEVDVGAYEISDLTPATTYDFVIVPVGIEPNERLGNESNQVTATTEEGVGELAYVDLFRIDKIIGLKAKYNLHWNGPIYADDYKIYQSELETGPFDDVTSEIENLDIINPCYGEHPRQNINRTYYYYVEAYRSGNLVGKSDVRVAPYPP